jgi:TolB-like protein/class 3 adenylate cyclase/tetratricopeptide (TPR) repeat protein
MSQSRQLAAIMFTDMVGYTALMGEDEQQAFELLKKNRSIQRPIIEKFNGRWIKEIGDGVLASFSSVSDAVYCAATIQKTCQNEPDLSLRIGIHLGEVVFEGGDVFGDGVNIASRLESLAPIGGILVSESVHRNLGNKRGVETVFVRKEKLKNVKEAINIYYVKVEGVEPTGLAELSDSSQQVTRNNKLTRKIASVIVVLVLALLSYFLYNGQKNHQMTVKAPEEVIDKSIAVIPFIDMSPDGNHEWFSDGISEELINALVRIPNLKVVGRTSSWTYKGINNKDLKIIGKELGVETVLEGSVRKSGNNVRITAQLVNTNDGFHLWSNTYDTELTDIFEVQDKITAAIVDAMSVHLVGETLSLSPTATANIDAYTVYLKARQRLASRGIDNLIEARRLFEETIQLDPNYDPAYSGLARTISLFYHFSTNFTVEELIEPAKKAANEALKLNPKNSEAYSVLGYVAAILEWDWSAAEKAFDKSLELTNEDAEIYNFIGDYYRLVIQHPKLAIEMESKALTLDPLHPVNHDDLGMAYALAKDWENALKYAQSARELGLNFGGNKELLLRSYINLGRMKEAENVVKRFDKENADKYVSLYLKAILATAKDQKNVAISHIENMINYPDIERYQWIGISFLGLGMNKEAAYWLEKAFDNREAPFTHIALPENLPNDPALQAVFDKPELNALFEIRRKYLDDSDSSTQKKFL